MKLHSVQNGRHTQFPNTEVDVTSLELARQHRGESVQERLRARRQIRSAAHEPGHGLGDLLHHLPGRHARGLGFIKDRHLFLEIDRHNLFHAGIPQFGLLGIGGGILFEIRFPSGNLGLHFPGTRGKQVAHGIGNIKILIFRHAQGLLGGLDLFNTQGLAMRLVGIMQMRGPVRNVRMGDDQGRAVLLRLGGEDRLIDFLIIMPVNFENIPFIPDKALAHIIAVGQIRVALDGDVIAVIKNHQLVQAEVTGKREHLMRNALHHIAIAAEHIRLVIHGSIHSAIEAGGHHALGKRHPGSHAAPLPQRT